MRHSFAKLAVLLTVMLTIGRSILLAPPLQAQALQGSPCATLNELHQTPVEYRAKARELMATLFAEQDQAGVQALLACVASRPTSLEDPLLAHEYLMLHYWQQDYSTLFAEANTFAAATPFLDMKMSQLPSGYSRGLLIQLFRHTFRNAQQYRSQIAAAALAEDEKAFALLLLRHTLHTETFAHYGQRAINLEAKDFMAKFPESRFAPTVRQHILVTYVPRPIGVVATAGFSQGAFGGELEEYWGPYGALAIALGMEYKGWLWGEAAFEFGNFYGGVREDFGTWPQGWTTEAGTLYGRFSLLAGAYPLRGTRGAIGPLVGLGFSTMAINQPDVQLTNPDDAPEVRSFLAPTFGAQAHWVLSHNPTNRFFFPDDAKGRSAVRLSYAFTPMRFVAPFENLGPGYTHSLTLGLSAGQWQLVPSR